MAKKNNTSPVRVVSTVSQELIKRSPVELTKLADGSTAYKKKGFFGRLKAWANPTAGREIKPIGFTKAKDENGKNVWVANEVMVVCKNHALQKIGYGIFATTVAAAVTLAIAHAIATTPAEDLTNNTPNDPPTTEVGTTIPDKDQDKDTDQETDKTPNDQEEETPGFVVETPEEGQDTTTPPDGFKVDTVTPPAADNTQGDTSTPTTPGQDTSTPGQDTTVPTTPGQDATTNNGGGSGTPDKLADLGMVLE